MAKDLSSNFRKEKNKKYGTEPINLLEIQFGGAIGTKYYSDREITVDGNTYEPVVKSWGDIDFIFTRNSTVNDFSVELINTLSSPISDIFSTVNPEGKTAILYQHYVDIDDDDKEIIFNGKISSPITYSVDSIKLDIVNKISDLKTKIGKVVTKADYPRSLDSHRGRVIPKVFGSVNDVPAVCIFTAGKSSLRETLNDTSTTIEVDDGGVFPTDTNWVLIIENEQIYMRNCTGGNTLTALQRGYNGTSAVLHTLGTQVYEQLSQFRYQVFDDTGGVKAASISNVRVNGKLLDATQYTIDQDNYPGQILFSSYPQIDQEKETEFDDYLFDTVIDDESVPYASDPDTLIDDNNSNYAYLVSGQKVNLQRVASLNNINQFKRAWLSVTYFTDREEWEGEVQVRALWDNNNLGLLPDPTFDPILEEEEELISANTNQIINPFNPVDPTQYGGANDIVKGPEAELVTETYSEETDPTGLLIEGIEVNPDFYEYQTQDLTEDNRVPPETLTAYTNGLTGVVAGLGQHTVKTFPLTWHTDVRNFTHLFWVYNGFRFSAPTNGGTARIMDVSVFFDSNFVPLNATQVEEFRVKKKGIRELFIIKPNATGFKLEPIYIHEIEQFYVVLKTFTDRRGTLALSPDQCDPILVELSGNIKDVYIKVEYEITKEVPVENPTPDPIEPTVTIPKAIRKSHEVEKLFEITPYVNDWVDLLNKSGEIRFESDGLKAGARLFIKKLQLYTESGSYSFEYTDEITADVDGYYVDGAQIDVNYGSDGELCTRPDQIFKLLLTWNSVFSISDIDANYYYAASSFYDTQNYRVDFAVVEEIPLIDLINKIAFQTRTDQYWEAGKHRIKVLEVSTSILKQLTVADIENIQVSRSNIDELVNSLTLYYNMDYSFLITYTPNKFRSHLTFENPDSISDFGEQKSEDTTFHFDVIRDDIIASHVANYYLSFYSVFRKYLNIKCFLNQIELDKHDSVGITFPLDNMSNTPARILSNKLILGDQDNIDQIELTVLLEDYTYHKLGVADVLSFTDNIQLALVPVVSLADPLVFSDAIFFGFEVNKSETIDFEDSMSYDIQKSIFIRDGYSGGWGNQSWGNSAWGGNDISFYFEDEVTVEKIVALGTGLLNLQDSVSLADDLVMLLISHEIDTNDALNLLVFIGESLTITKV